MFRILVVDDDRHTRMLLRAVLENANYTVTTAGSGNGQYSPHFDGDSQAFTGRREKGISCGDE